MQADLAHHSIASYVEHTSNAALKNSYLGMLVAYNAIHEKHRTKVYGFVKLGFRAGRIATGGGHKATATIATEPAVEIQKKFLAASDERIKPAQHLYARVSKHSQILLAPQTYEINLSSEGLDFQPGDWIRVLPKNDQQLVDELLEWLSYQGDELLVLNQAWQHYLKSGWGISKPCLSVREFFHYVHLGQIEKSPVHFSFNPEDEHYIGHFFRPLTARTYSVAPFYQQGQHIVSITITHHYKGVASNYLVNSSSEPLFIQKMANPGFHLPQDTSQPLILFAAGTGISPFIGFLNTLKTTPRPVWLFFSTKDEVNYYHQQRIMSAVKENGILFTGIFSRVGKKIHFDGNNWYNQATIGSAHIDELITDHYSLIKSFLRQDQGHIYVCGSFGFEEAIRAIFQALDREYFAALVQNHHYHADAFSATITKKTANSYSLHAVSLHNKAQDCWIIISGDVYDVTAFLNIHPGGHKVIKISAGMDATKDYWGIGHHHSAQIETMLAHYKLGDVRYPHLNKVNQVHFQSWLQFLYALLEMKNTLENNLDLISSSYLFRDVFINFIRGAFEEVFNNQFARLYEKEMRTSIHFDHQHLDQVICEDKEDPILKDAMQFAENVQNETRKVVEHFEIKEDDFDPVFVSTAAQGIKDLTNHYLSHAKASGNLSSSPVSVVPLSMFSGCPFLQSKSHRQKSDAHKHFKL